MNIQQRGRRVARRAKSAARSRVAAASVALPTERGPAQWQHLLGRARIAESRRVLRVDRDPAAALQLVQPLLDDPALRSRVWTLVAEAREERGDHSGALDAARTAVGGTDVDFGARLVHQRLAARAGGQREAADAIACLVDEHPRNNREVQAVLTALRTTGPTHVERFRTNLEGSNRHGWGKQLEETTIEVDLRAATEDCLDQELANATQRLRNPLPVVARALDARRSWARLATYADAHSFLEPTAVAQRDAALELRRAASRALTAGHTTAAQRLAGHALALNPRDVYARETWTNASDQILVARDGWALAVPVSGPRYPARSEAVLSVLAQSLPHRSGGYATRSHGVLRGLDALGWDVEAVTRLGFPYDRWPKADTRQVPDVDVVDGIRYSRILEPGRRRYPQYPLSSYVDRYATAIQQHARRHRPALLHASSFHVNGLATQLASARLGVPYVYEMRGLEDLMKGALDPEFDDTDRRRFLDTVEGAVCLGAERVFVITEALRREMATRGVPEEKMVVLPNGVHTALFQPRERDADLEASLGVRGKTVIGYAGGLVGYEGLDLLLHAVADLKHQRTGPAGVDFHVVIVGDGYVEPALHALAETLRLGDVVTFTGRVPHADVPAYLSLFDVAPFPRVPLPVCEMISPIKPFESMAAGKAVVVSSVAALTEIVQDGTTGLVFQKGCSTDLARVLTTLLDSPELRLELGHTARRWVVDERDWGSIVRTVDSTYREILESGRVGVSADLLLEVAP